MRRISTFFSVIIILLLGYQVFFSSSQQKKLTNNPSVLENVLSNQEIRASYLLYPPYFMQDPNTKELSGIFYEITELLGEKLTLDIIWTEEVGYEDIFTGLDAGRYDLFAGGLWPGATRAKVGYFSTPAFYSVITAWARPDDRRFDNDFSMVNNSNIRIATIDGAMEDIIANADFPNAKKISLPQLSPFSQNLLNVSSGKADITFAEPSTVNRYLKENPNTLKEVQTDNALRIFGNSFVMKQGEDTFKQMIDIAIQEALYSGEIDRILKKYETTPNEFPRVALPYRR